MNMMPQLGPALTAGNETIVRLRDVHKSYG